MVLNHVWMWFAYASLCLCIVGLLASLGRRLRSLSRLDWKGIRCRLEKWFRPAARSTEEKDAHIRSQRLARSWKLERMMRLCGYLPLFVLIPLTSGVRSHIQNGFDSDSVLKESAYLPMYSWIGVGSTLAHAFSHRINLNMAFVLTLVVHVFAAQAVHESKSGMEFLATGAGVCTLRLAQSALLGNLQFNLCLQLTWSAVMIGHWTTLNFNEEESHVFTLRRCVVGEFIVTVISICVGIIIDSATYAQAKATVEGKSLRQFDATAQSFLSVLCDAVVYLGSDLRLSSPSPQLAALLLRRELADEDNLLGRHICDFVAQEDRNVLEQYLEGHSGSTVSPSVAKTLTTALIDSAGSHVSVQILYSHFLDLDDMPSIVLGIRELDMEQLPLSTHDTSSEVSVLMDAAHFSISRCDPSSTTMGFGSAKDRDFRKWLIDPHYFEEHVRRFFEDSCLDVFDMQEPTDSWEDSAVGGHEIVVRRFIGLHKFTKRDKKSHAIYDWDGNLTLESSPSLFAHVVPMLKVRIAKMTQLSLREGSHNSGSSFPLVIGHAQGTAADTTHISI